MPSDSPRFSTKLPFSRLGRWLIGLAVLVVLAFAMPRPEQPQDMVKTAYLADLARLDSATVALRQTVLAQGTAAAVQAAFCRARLRYKRVEWLTEYYFPVSAKSLNGPPVDEADIDDGVALIIPPDGFQVIEPMLYPLDPTQPNELLRHLTSMHTSIDQLRRVATLNQLDSGHIFDAMQLEVFRLITLGITGFDSPVALQSLPEAVVVLDGMRQTVRQYPLATTSPALAQELDAAFVKASHALNHQSFNDFDRLHFIRDYSYPLSRLLVEARTALALPVATDRRFLSASARTLSDSGVFNPMYFASFKQQPITPDRVSLGRMLFYSPALSATSRSCATCHQPDRAFTDGEPTAKMLDFAQTQPTRRPARNTPTLLNAALQSAQFMDSRVFFLEDQINDVVHNPLEMGGSILKAMEALQRDTTYTNLFKRAYPDGLTEDNLKNALANYIRSLISLDARPDRYLRGETSTLSVDERRGFNLFMGKAKCATCHYFPIFNGTVPPAYIRTESEVIGTPATAEEHSPDADSGRYQFTKLPLHARAFKVPTIRNIAATAPYMHNGVYRTLEEVVEFYNKGGGRGIGFSIDNQTLPPDNLHLTRVEKRALIAFMKAL